MGEATTDPVRLPPGPRIPKAVMGISNLTARHRAVDSIGRRYVSAFTVNQRSAWTATSTVRVASYSSRRSTASG